MNGRWLVLFVLALSACGAGSTGGIHARMGYSEERGLRVVEVAADGPAARAGLQAGDRIRLIDGAPVREMDLEEVLEQLRGPVGSTVVLEVERNGERVQLETARVPYLE